MPATLHYGPAPDQVGDLWLPDGAEDGPPLPVAALWHGGGYVPEVDRELMEGIAGDLCRRGWVVWNLEYRRLETGGGWPETFLDAAAGLDELAELAARGLPLDLDRVVAVGFSAGGPLALWAAGRRDGVVRPIAVVNLAGLGDLESIARDDEISANLRRLIGRPDLHPDVYAEANPVARLPLGVPQLHVHGDADENIPVDHARRFVERARAAGDPAELAIIPGAGHFDLADPRSEAWKTAVAWLDGRR